MSDLLISFIFIALGAISFCFGSDALYILGATLCFAGLILGLVLKSDYLIPDRGVICKRRTLNLPHRNKEKIIDFLKGKETVISTDETGSLLVYLYYKKDRSGGFVQVNEFENYEYRPCSGLLEIGRDKVEKLLK